MSLRAIKKRENCSVYTNAGGAAPGAGPTQARKSLFKKQQANLSPTATTTTTTNQLKLSGNRSIKQYLSNDILNTLKQQQLQLGRQALSNPDLFTLQKQINKLYNNSSLVRTKSDGDINSILNHNTSNQTNNFDNSSSADSSSSPHSNSSIKRNITLQRRNLLNAKSEVCLESITSHDYVTEHPLSTTTTPTKSKMYKNNNNNNNNHSQQTVYNSSQSLGSSNHHHRHHQPLQQQQQQQQQHHPHHHHRRMSECSSDGYSQRTSSRSASELTLSSSLHLQAANNEPNAVLRVPIIGYEVMEERARFTVYKLRVENPITNDCWLVLRRYTDFVRLNTKLKQIYPYINLALPRKKIFGDNFNAVFLDNRVQGLQMFVNSIMAKEELRQCDLVREFFCLDEPPSYSESMEECRAIFEAQEETIAHLKLQIQNKNDLILNLQQKLRDEIMEKEKLQEAFMNLSIQNNPSTYNQ